MRVSKDVVLNRGWHLFEAGTCYRKYGRCLASLQNVDRQLWLAT